jgi:hypothetical protein
MLKISVLRRAIAFDHDAHEFALDAGTADSQAVACPQFHASADTFTVQECPVGAVILEPGGLIDQ